MARTANVGRVSVSLEANTAQYTRNLRNAQATTRTATNEMSDSITRFGRASSKANKLAIAGLGALTAAFGAVQLGSFIAESTEAGVQQQFLAAQIGITTNELRAYDYAAKFVGKSGEEMADVFKEVTERFEDASRGTGEAVALLTELNVPIKDFLDLAPDQAFAKLTNELDKLSDGDALFWADKFGDQFFEIYQRSRDLGVSIPNLAKEYRELFGLTPKQLDDDLIKMNETIIKLETGWSLFGQTFSAAIATPATEAIEGILKDIKELGGGDIQRGLIITVNGVVSTMTTGINGLLSAVELMSNAFSQLYNKLIDVGLIEGDKIGQTSSFQIDLIEARQEEEEVLLRVAQARRAYDQEGYELALDRLTATKAELKALRGYQPISFGRIEASQLDVPPPSNGTASSEQPPQSAQTTPYSFGTTSAASFNDSVYGKEQIKLQAETNRIILAKQTEQNAALLSVQNQYLLSETQLVDQQRQAELAKVDNLFSAKLLSEQEYEMARLAIIQESSEKITAIKTAEKEAEVNLSKLVLDQIAGFNISLTEDSSDTAKALFAIQQASAIAIATLNATTAYQDAYSSTVGTNAVKATAGTVASITAWGNVAAVGATTLGQFHSGSDEIAQTGSYILKAGEAVIQPSANRDLIKFLKDPAEASGGGGSTVVNQTINGGAMMSQGDFEHLLKRSADSVAGIVQQKSRQYSQRK